MLIDTHAHLNFNAFKNDAGQVLRRSLDNNVWMINVGSQYETSKRAVEIAEKYPEGVYAAVGLHPIHLETGLVKIKIDPEEIRFQTKEESFDYEKYRELALRSLLVHQSFSGGGGEGGKVVAIGEIGLDYYYRPKTKKKLAEFKEKQKTAFLKQLDLAKELRLPVIFHCRMGHDDLIDFLSGEHELRGVIHCFTGTQEQAQKYMEMGFYLGFNGLIFKPAPHRNEVSGAGLNLWDEIIKRIPLDKLLIETDCPYLTPLQITGRNEPIYVKHIAQRIAKIKNISYEEIAKITTENAKKLFKI